jgi:ABC-type transport system involved in cytochrome c biogenesis permease component
MLPLVIYALSVFSVSLISIRVIRRKGAALLVVALYTIIAPVLMQGLSSLVIGYLDPFWEWETFWLAIVALAASVMALGVGAAIEHGQEER